MTGDIFDEENEELEEMEEEGEADLSPVEQAFVDCYEAGKDEDEVMMAMVQTGEVKFKAVSKLYNNLSERFGYVTNKKQRAEIVADCIQGGSIADEVGLKAVIANVVELSKGVSDNAAKALVRHFAKKNELDIYKIPKGEGRTNIRNELFEYIILNPTCTEADVVAFVKKNGTENMIKNADRYVGFWEWGCKIRNQAIDTLMDD